MAERYAVAMSLPECRDIRLTPTDYHSAMATGDRLSEVLATVRERIESMTGGPFGEQNTKMGLVAPSSAAPTTTSVTTNASLEAFTEGYGPSQNPSAHEVLDEVLTRS
jgi:hypothetical protein